MKRKQKDTSVKDEPEEVKEDETPPETIDSEITWPPQDIRKLLEVIRSHIPKDDHHSFRSRMGGLPWDDIAFDKYNGEECQKTFKLIIKRIRGFRLMEEILNDAEKWLEKPWTNFYARKLTKRHPDCPKRPTSARMLFQCDNNHLWKGAKGMREFQLKIGALFEALPPEKRAEYEMKYQLKREEYERLKNTFMLKNPELFVKNKKKGKTTVAFDNDTAFKYYIQDQLKSVTKHDSLPMKDLIDVFEKNWNELSPSEKIVWFKKSKGPQKKIANEVKPKAKYFRQSTYTVFAKKILKSEEMKDIPPKDRMRKVALLYKTLKPEDIEELKIELAQEKLLYDSKNPVEQDNTDSVRKKRKKASKVVDAIEIQTSEMDDAPPKKKKKTKNDNDTNENSHETVPTNKNNPKNENKKIESEEEKKTTFPGEPEVPPENPFNLFAKEKRVKKNYSDEKLVKKWNNLEKSVHKEYKKKLKEIKNNYLEEYTKFVSSLSKKELKKFTAFKNLV